MDGLSMQIFIIITIFLVTLSSNAQEFPDNSWSSGSTWYCNDGFKKINNRCIKLNVPDNAWVSGSTWYCNDGFKKRDNQCIKLNVPQNAWVSGSTWYCNDGFKKRNNQCIKLNVPQNAWVSGSTWYCNDGFKKQNNDCIKFKVPQNAFAQGGQWFCNDGFKRAGSSCRAMTQQELQRQIELEKAVIAEVQHRRAQGVSGDDCETEFKTNAEVCVEITAGDIDCNESYSGSYYNDCDVSLSYKVSTDYRGGAYLEVEVECMVEIEYKGRNIYSTQAESSFEDETHDLYAHDSDSETLNFNFSFGSYQEITSAKINNAECEIDSVDMY
jgi:hypothetical protein